LFAPFLFLKISQPKIENRPKEWKIIALNALPFFEKEAKERQGTRTDLMKNIPPILAEGEATEQLGKLMGVNRQYIYEASYTVTVVTLLEGSA